MTKKELVKGKQYRFKHSSGSDGEPITYIGYNWSGNGYWHQFAKDGKVWSEIQDAQLELIEPVN